MKSAFQLHRNDNVVTLLCDAAAGDRVVLHGEGGAPEITLAESVAAGHKAALRRIEAGEQVVKFGVPIGRASKAIDVGRWVHLHNVSSSYDIRSSTLEVETGAPTDTRYE